MDGCWSGELRKEGDFGRRLFLILIKLFLTNTKRTHYYCSSEQVIGNEAFKSVSVHNNGWCPSLEQVLFSYFSSVEGNSEITVTIADLLLWRLNCFG